MLGKGPIKVGGLGFQNLMGTGKLTLRERFQKEIKKLKTDVLELTARNKKITDIYN